eukprot:scaffold614_cov367-Prasinococcus_capsulatus_cf.AAC.2
MIRYDRRIFPVIVHPAPCVQRGISTQGAFPEGSRGGPPFFSSPPPAGAARASARARRRRPSHEEGAARRPTLSSQVGEDSHPAAPPAPPTDGTVTCSTPIRAAAVPRPVCVPLFDRTRLERGASAARGGRKVGERGRRCRHGLARLASARSTRVSDSAARPRHCSRLPRAAPHLSIAPTGVDAGGSQALAATLCPLFAANVTQGLLTCTVLELAGGVGGHPAPANRATCSYASVALPLRAKTCLHVEPPVVSLIVQRAENLPCVVHPRYTVGSSLRTGLAAGVDECRMERG